MGQRIGELMHLAQEFPHMQDTGYYELLAEFSTYVNHALLYDIGTSNGCSALALSYNLNNQVRSYDINKSARLVQHRGNIQFVIGNFFDDQELFSSPLIFFDVDPHNGEIEKQFMEWLEKNEYTGIVIFDDIHLNNQMINFWKNIKQKKEDATERGHSTGTGIVYFTRGQ
jgi:predicted O-methyltransferase YrrM